MTVPTLRWLRDGGETISRPWHDIWYDGLAPLIEFLRAEFEMAEMYGRYAWRIQADRGWM